MQTEIIIDVSLNAFANESYLADRLLSMELRSETSDREEVNPKQNIVVKVKNEIFSYFTCQ